MRAPARNAVAASSATNSRSARVASIGLNSTSSVKSRARATIAATMPTTLSRRRVELVRELHVARVHEDVDARRGRGAERLARGLDVLRHGARERADARVADVARDAAHGLHLLRRAHREARLDDVHAGRGERLGDLALVARAEGDAGGLLAVAQRGVEDPDTIRFGHRTLLVGRGPGARVASRDVPETRNPLRRLGGRGFSLRAVSTGLAADGPLSRPRKGESESAEELPGRDAHRARGISEPALGVKSRAPERPPTGAVCFRAGIASARETARTRGGLGRDPPRAGLRGKRSGGPLRSAARARVGLAGRARPTRTCPTPRASRHARERLAGPLLADHASLRAARRASLAVIPALPVFAAAARLRARRRRARRAPAREPPRVPAARRSSRGTSRCTSRSPSRRSLPAARRAPRTRSLACGDSGSRGGARASPRPSEARWLASSLRRYAALSSRAFGALVRRARASPPPRGLARLRDGSSSRACTCAGSCSSTARAGRAPSSIRRGVGAAPDRARPGGGAPRRAARERRSARAPRARVRRGAARAGRRPGRALDPPLGADGAPRHRRAARAPRRRRPRARARQLARALAPPLEEPYFLRLLAADRGEGRARATCCPTATAPRRARPTRLLELLHELFGNRAQLDRARTRSPTAPSRTRTRRPADARVLLFNLAQSPEHEVHGACVRGGARRGRRARSSCCSTRSPTCARLGGDGAERLAAAPARLGAHAARGRRVGGAPARGARRGGRALAGARAALAGLPEGAR